MNFRKERGNAIIELTLVLPFLLLIIAGMVDFGFLFYNKQVITNASREGARAGISDLSDKGIIPDSAFINTIVQNYCDKRLVSFGGSTTPTTEVDDSEGLYYPAYLKVKVTFQYSFLLSPVLNWFGNNFGPTKDISAQTVMQIERAPS